MTHPFITHFPIITHLLMAHPLIIHSFTTHLLLNPPSFSHTRPYDADQAYCLGSRGSSSVHCRYLMNGWAWNPLPLHPPTPTDFIMQVLDEWVGMYVDTDMVTPPPPLPLTPMSLSTDPFLESVGMDGNVYGWPIAKDARIDVLSANNRLHGVNGMCIDTVR